MACQFDDEQTGGHCANLADRFTGTKRKWFTFTNGLHIDSLDPETFNRWFDFLELYVAGRRPQMSPATAAAAPIIYQTAMGVPGVTLPPDPIQNQPSYEAALSAFQSQPSVRILFDNGAGGAPGTPYPGFERSFNRFPIPRHQAASWFFGANGLMTRKPAKKGRKGGSTSFTWDKTARPAHRLRGHQHRRRRPLDRPTRASTGGSPRPAPPLHSSPRRWGAMRRSSVPARCMPGSGPRSRTSTCR